MNFSVSSLYMVGKDIESFPTLQGFV